MKMTPWQWLEGMQRCDLTPEQRTYEWIRIEMQNRYPGPYRLVRTKKVYDSSLVFEYVMQFDDPAEEIFYRLKWS